MNKVIQIDEYRKGHVRPADALHERWACGTCGEHSWSVTTSGRLSCTHCGTVAANLRVSEPPVSAEADPTACIRDDSRRVSPAGQWWWTWARQ